MGGCGTKNEEALVVHKGFKSLVDAEPGSMGAGAGAAAAVDNLELSPRGAAIEKAEAELRRLAAVREERTREQELVVKGGDYLGVKFGESLPAQLSSLSPTEALPDQFVSERERGGSDKLVAVGPATTSNEAVVSGGAKVETKCEAPPCLVKEPDSLSFTTRNEEADGTRSSDNGTAGVDSECVGGASVGVKNQMHVQRNRPRSLRVGNGHAASKAVEKSVGGERPAVVAERKPRLDSLEDEAMLDVRYEVLSHQCSHGLARKWSGLIGSQECGGGNEPSPRCGGAVLEQPAAVDDSSRVASPSHVSVQSGDAQVHSNVDTGEREAVASGCLVDSVDGSSAHVQKSGEVGEGDGAASPKNASNSGSVESGPGDLTMIKVESGGIGQIGNEHLRVEKKERVGLHLIEEGHDMQRVDGANVLPADTSADVAGSPMSHKSAGVVKKSAASRGGNNGRVASRDRSAIEEKKGGIHRVRIKCEDGVAENRARPSPADAEPGVEQSSGGPSCEEELRAEGQAGAVVGEIPRAMARSPGLSASLNCKYPGAAVSWEKEQDVSVKEEVEGRQAEVEVKCTKAHDDRILQMAENLKAKRRYVEKWHNGKKTPELGKRKCHWDFVLEEMKWMAKDFYEERKLKLAVCARKAHSAAYERNKEEYVALDIVKKQRKRASFIAFAVNQFWRMAEASLTKGKAGHVVCDKSVKAEEGRNEGNEAVPMDVDVPASREAVNKLSQSRKAEEKTVGVKRYAEEYLSGIGCGRVAEAVAPATPDQYVECNGIPYFVDEESLAKEPLFYTVPAGAMEGYRDSVEAEYARHVEEYEERRAAAVAEAEALAAAAEASGDASLGSDFGLSEYLVDGGSQDYEFQTDFMGDPTRISKKKRKKILKSSNAGRRLEGVGVQGFPYQSSGMSTPEMGLQSPIVTGKRAIPGELGSNSVLGSIPVKRARSSATSFRPRANNLNISPAGGYPRTGLESQDEHEDEEVGLAEGSERFESGNDRLGGSGFGANKFKRKKKPKGYPGMSSSRGFDGGMGAGPSGKSADGDSQDVVRFEQMKRKGEPSWALPVTSSDASLGTPTDTPGTPGSQGPSGQQNVKKQKALKNELNSEAATPATAGNQHATQQMVSGPLASKLLKQSSMRDRNRRPRPNKVPTNTPAGVGIPWSTSEDQAILNLVHDLGPNWDLVSDVLSSNSQIKGIFRKPDQCKERHLALTERSSADGSESHEDPSSLQSQGSKANVKGPRVHGVPEEDSFKHLECIIQVVTKHRLRKNSSDSQDQKVVAPTHPSHGIAISQYCPGGLPNPLEVCAALDKASNGDTSSLPFPGQAAQGNVIGPPLINGPVMRPPSGGLSLLAGNTSFNMGQPSISSSAAMSAAAARDAQRFGSKLSPEDANRLRMAGGNLPSYNVRRPQQPGVTGALPMLSGLPNQSDLTVVPINSNGAMLGALNRGLSLPRGGLPNLGSPVVPNLVSSGFSGMIPPAGAFPPSNMARRTASLVHNLRVGAGTEEQRLQILQQLQSQAQQGDSQAAAALSNLSSDMVAMNSQMQPFSPQHQPQHFQQQTQQQAGQHQQQHQHQQVQNQQRNQLQQQQQQQQQQHMQMQQQGQTYYNTAALMKEHQQRQQQQSLQQQQQKQRLMGNLPPTPQTSHMLVAPHVPTLPPQQLGSQSHMLPRQPQHNSIQKQQGLQQGVVPQAGLGPSAPASPARSGQSNPPAQANQGPEQAGQSSGSTKAPQGKQTQTPQSSLQQASQRNPAGPSRGGNPQDLSSSQTGQATAYGGSGNNQAASDVPEQMQAGQKMQPQSGQVQGGSTSSVSQAGLGVPPSKGPQQSQPPQQQQNVQGGAAKQQQGLSGQTGSYGGGPQAASMPSSSQQLQQPMSVGSAAQQMQRNQAQQLQQQAAQRRLQQTRHPGATALGMPMAGPLGKTGMQQAGQAVSSQMAGLPNHNAYQLGATGSMGTPVGLSNANSHGVVPSGGLSSSTMGGHSTQWKPNQGTTPLSGGLYNLTRNSAGPGQVSGTTPSGLPLPGFNGSSHGMSMAQTVGGGPGTQKHGMSVGVNGRAPTGAVQGTTSGQRSQQNGSVMAVAPGGPGNPGMRPPGPGGGGGAVQGSGSGLACARVPGGEGSTPVASPMVGNRGQAVSPSGAPASQKPTAGAGAGVAVSTAGGSTGGSIPSGSSVVVPDGGGPGPGLPEASTPASSS